MDAPRLPQEAPEVSYEDERGRRPIPVLLKIKAQEENPAKLSASAAAVSAPIRGTATQNNRAGGDLPFSGRNHCRSCTINAPAPVRPIEGVL